MLTKCRDTVCCEIYYTRTHYLYTGWKLQVAENENSGFRFIFGNHRKFLRKPQAEYFLFRFFFRYFFYASSGLLHKNIC